MCRPKTTPRRARYTSRTDPASQSQLPAGKPQWNTRQMRVISKNRGLLLRQRHFRKRVIDFASPSTGCAARNRLRLGRLRFGSGSANFAALSHILARISFSSAFPHCRTKQISTSLCHRNDCGIHRTSGQTRKDRAIDHKQSFDSVYG